MIARLAPSGQSLGEPSLAQRFAEELVVDMVRKHVDVVSLLELEREVLEALGGSAPLPGDLGPIDPLTALAATLIDHAFQRVEHEWRESRTLAQGGECVCCAVEQQQARRKKGSVS